jgi:hypothetical protein
MDEAGYIMEDWNMDSGDSAGVGIPASKIVANVKKGRTYPQSVLLMHDGIGHGESAKALPEIIQYFKDRGFAFGLLTPDVQPIQFRIGKVKWKRNESFDAFTAHEQEAEQVRETWTVEAGEGGDGAGGASTANGDVNGGSSADVPEAPSDKSNSDTVTEATYGVAEEAGKGAAVGTELGKASSETTPGKDRSGNSCSTSEQGTDPLPLTVYAGTKPIRFGSGECELHNGQYYVSLRKLVEGEGGKVTWDNATRSADVKYGMISVEYELTQQTIWQQFPGQTDHVERFADMRLRNGTLLVPLRRTAELLGDYVNGYTVKDQEREVTLNVGWGQRLGFYWSLRANPPEPLRDIVGDSP